MKIYKLEINPELYRKIPLEERVLFLAVGHFTNEINALRKLILIGSNTKENSAIGQHGVTAQNLIFVKYLVTKVVEAYKFLEKEQTKPYFKLFRKDNNIETHINNLHEYFKNGNSRLNWLRDKLGAHYDAGIIKKVAKDNLSDTHYLYLSEQAGNSLYFLSEEILFKAISKNQPPQEAFPQLVDDVYRVAGWITDCAQDIMIYIANNYAEDTWQNKLDEDNEVVEVRDSTELSLPFFIDFSNAKF